MTGSNKSTWWDYAAELGFYLKIAVACTILQLVFEPVVSGLRHDFAAQVVLLWGLGSLSFYGFGFLIEAGIKRRPELRARLSARRVEVRPQRYSFGSVGEVLRGVLKSVAVVAVVLLLAPEVQRSDAFIACLGWFLMRIAVADLCFYVAHRTLHHKRFSSHHRKHHQYRDTSSFVAGHKSNVELVITTLTDLLPIFLLGYDVSQLLAWVVVGNIYNLEAHSSLSMIFIHSDFHDRHHTHFKGNYGINGLWDRLLGTLSSAERHPGPLFLVTRLERWVANRKPDAQ